jgi:hypothetical protein
LNPELFLRYSINSGLLSLVEYPTVIIILYFRILYLLYLYLQLY